MRAGGTPAAVDFRRGRGRICRSRNDREHQRFFARRAPFLPKPQRGYATARAGASWRIHLPELGEKLGRYADKKLRERGVEIHPKSESRSGAAERNRTEQRREDRKFNIGLDGGFLAKSDAGSCRVCERTRSDESECQTSKSKAVDGLWALGDCALVPDPATGSYCPPTAQHASREGKVVAQNIIASVYGKPKKPFRFKTLGSLAAIGRRTGVARILGVNFSGFLAWFLWRGIYWSKLPRTEKKVRVAIDWALDVFFSKDFVQYLDQRALANPDRNRRGAVESRPNFGSSQRQRWIAAGGTSWSPCAMNTTTESTATRSFLTILLVGIVAGLLAGVAMLVTMGILRLAFGWPTPTELIFDRLFPFLTVEFFIGSLVKAGGYTPLKLQGVYGALAGQVAVAAIGGVIYSWYLNRLERRQRRTTQIMELSTRAGGG